MNKMLKMIIFIAGSFLNNSIVDASAAAGANSINKENHKPLACSIFRSNPLTLHRKPGAIALKLKPLAHSASLPARLTIAPKNDAATVASAASKISTTNGIFDRIIKLKTQISQKITIAQLNQKVRKSCKTELEPLLLELKELNPVIAAPLVVQFDKLMAQNEAAQKGEKMARLNKEFAQDFQQYSEWIEELRVHNFKALAEIHQIEHVMKQVNAIDRKINHCDEESQPRIKLDQKKLKIELYKKALDLMRQKYFSKMILTDPNMNTQNPHFLNLVKIGIRLHALDPATPLPEFKKLYQQLIRCELRQNKALLLENINAELELEKPDFNIIAFNLNQLKSYADKLAQTTSLTVLTDLVDLNQLIRNLGVKIKDAPISYYFHCLEKALCEDTLDSKKIDGILATMDKKVRPHLYKDKIQAIVQKLESIIINKIKLLDKQLKYQHIALISEDCLQINYFIDILNAFDPQKATHLFQLKSDVEYECSEACFFKLEQIESESALSNDDAYLTVSFFENLASLANIIKNKNEKLTQIMPDVMSQNKIRIDNALKKAEELIESGEQKIKQEEEALNPGQVVAERFAKVRALAEQIEKLLASEDSHSQELNALFSQLTELARHTTNCITEKEMQTSCLLQELHIKFNQKKMAYCLECLSKNLAHIKQLWEQKVCDLKKIKELQEIILIDLNYSSDLYKLDGNRAAENGIKIATLADRAWAYIVPDIKDQAEAALKNIKAAPTAENKKALIEAFGMIVKLMRISRYLPDCAQKCIMQLYSQMKPYLFDIREIEIRGRLEILHKKIDSGDLTNIDAEIESLTALIRVQVKIDKNRCIEKIAPLCHALLKKCFDKIEQLKIKIKSDTLSNKLNTLTLWKTCNKPIKQIMAVLEEFLDQSLNAEHRVFSNNRDRFFAEYCTLIKNHLELSVQEINALKMPLNSSQIIAQLPKIQREIEDILAFYNSNIFIKNINLQMFKTFRKEILASAERLKESLNELIANLQRNALDDAATQCLTIVTKMAHDLSKMLSARGLMLNNENRANKTTQIAQQALASQTALQQPSPPAPPAACTATAAAPAQK